MFSKLSNDDLGYVRTIIPLSSRLTLLFFYLTAQAEELRKYLWAKNVPAKVYVGMRYWHPFTEEAIEQAFDHPFLIA